MSATLVGSRVIAARELAHTLLDGLPQRWAHTIGVAHHAEQLAVTVPVADRKTLVAAAWLHDIGYSPATRHTGFHPLDGAAYLDRHGWPSRISALVAHHSGAWYVAQQHLLGHALAEYPHERSPVSDALCYADQITGPQGQPLSIHQRMADMLARHGGDSAQARAHHHRGPYLLAVARRVAVRLARTGSVRGDEHDDEGARTVHPLHPAQLNVGGRGWAADEGQRAGRVEPA